MFLARFALLMKTQREATIHDLTSGTNEGRDAISIRPTLRTVRGDPRWRSLR